MRGKIKALVLLLALLAGMSVTASAQTKYRTRDGRYASAKPYGVRAEQQRRYEQRRRDYYYDGRYYDDRSFWERHRDKLTVAGGTAAGAVIGGMAGGKKGALIGAAAGAGGSALYTYKMRDRDRRRRY